MLSNCSFKLTKVPDHLMCNLKKSGAFTEKLYFVNFSLIEKIILFSYILQAIIWQT